MKTGFLNLKRVIVVLIEAEWWRHSNSYGFAVLMKSSATHERSV